MIMNLDYQFQTLNEFIIKQQKAYPDATGDLTRLLGHLGVAAKVVSKEVNAAGLGEILGKAGKTNIQGEDVMRLDEFANEQFIKILTSSGEVCALASEENHDIITFDNSFTKEGKYVVCIDPLDGSSNIDVNVSIGTVFSVYQRVTPVGSLPDETDILQAGTKQVVGGYVIYGSSTMMVYTTGFGVNGFTLDPAIGEFCLSHFNIKTPVKGKIYSVNEGYYRQFQKGVQNYIDHCKNGVGGSYTARYIGSMIADFHRNLLKGGIFMYPSTHLQEGGKLRLLYEANPIAFVAEQAGGLATDGYGNRILEIQPGSIHQRTPLFTGSRKMVEEVEKSIQEE